MVAEFENGGVRFKYPSNWGLERDDSDSGWAVTIQSPETAFFLLSFRDDGSDPAELIETALKTLREDYPDLEAEDCVDSLAGQPALGHNIQFYSLDLTNTCWTRSLYCSGGTLLLLCQFNDLEQEKYEPVMRAMCASLVTDSD